jgi:hypothetical protein
MRIRSTLIRRLVELPDLKLKRFCIVDEDILDMHHVSEDALVRYVNGVGSTQDWQSVYWRSIDESYNTANIRRFVQNERHIWSTKLVYYEDDVDAECCSDADSGHNPDCAQYRRSRNPPYWRNGHFQDFSFYGPRLYCVQELDPDRANHSTRVWKFTSRDGEVGYGTDPLNFFDEWDLEAGDREEPTPYGKGLRDLAQALSWAIDRLVAGLGNLLQGHSSTTNKRTPPGMRNGVRSNSTRTAWTVRKTRMHIGYGKGIFWAWEVG